MRFDIYIYIKYNKRSSATECSLKERFLANLLASLLPETGFIPASAQLENRKHVILFPFDGEMLGVNTPKPKGGNNTLDHTVGRRLKRELYLTCSSHHRKDPGRIKGS